MSTWLAAPAMKSWTTRFALAGAWRMPPVGAYGAGCGAQLVGKTYLALPAGLAEIGEGTNQGHGHA